MKWQVILLFVPTLCWGALSTSISGVSQTQAILAIRGYSGSCLIQVSTSPTYSPVIPDVNPAEYPTSSSDSLRSDTLTWADGTRIVTIGHKIDDRALSAFTPFYYQISGCGGSSTGTFTTANVSVGSSLGTIVPFNSSSPWNYGFPQISLASNTSWYIDPMTGIKEKPVNKAGDLSWRTSGGPLGAQSGFTAFAHYAGGIGWQSTSSIVNENTSTATTTGTNPVDLYPDNLTAPWFGVSVDDIGIVVWGSATVTTGSNAQISLCISTNPANGCIGTSTTVVLTGTFGQVLSGSTDPNSPWPGTFPQQFFAGWGLTAPLGPEYQYTTGTLTCVTSTCTISGITKASHFQSILANGNKVYVAGSAPTCAQNMCTIKSVRDASIAYMQENVSVSGVSYTSYPLSVRVSKVTSTGQVTVGLAFKLAGSRQLYNADASTWDCNPNGFTSGDGHFGFLCQYVVTAQVGSTALYFISGDGTVRPLWTTRMPQSVSCYTNPGSGNINNPQFTAFTPTQVVMGQTDSKTSFFKNPDTTGTAALYKVVYSSDAGPWSQVPNDFSGSYDGNYNLKFSPCDNMSITNITPVSSSQTVIQQIESAYPSYSTTTFGTSFLFAMISGKYAYFNNNYGGQNNPAWIAIFDVSGTTASIVNLIHTLDGTGTNGRIMWGGHHTTRLAAPVGTAELVEDAMTGGSSTVLFGGPFIAKPMGFLLADGVTYSTYSNLSSTWTTDYKGTCPAGNAYESLGATGNDCITFKFPAGGVCNSTPMLSGFNEVTHYPCPWNAAYSQPVTMAIGNNFVDNDNAFCNPKFDCEHFRIIQAPTVNGDGTLKVVAQRDAVPDYCCRFRTLGGINNCVPDSDAQMTHISSWTAIMAPNAINGCAAAYYYYNATDQSIFEEGRNQQGHILLANGITPGNISLLGSSNGKPNLPFNQAFNLPTTFYTYAAPTFHGTTLAVGAGGLQAYTEAAGGVPWMTDSNSFNANFPGGPEASNNSSGAITISTITTSISSVTVIGVARSGANYKTYPMIGWAGRFPLKDISGPGSSVDNTPFSMCFALNAGECHSGSLANEVYTNVPQTYNSGICSTGQSWLMSPCVTMGNPSGGGLREQRIISPDPYGVGSRFMSYAMTGGGQFYPFATAFPLPDGTAVLAPAHQTQQWGSMGFLMASPPWVEDSIPKNDFINIPVKLSTGAARAEIRFGYNTSFQCTTRNESCATAGTAPFSFISESRTLTSCALGCTINMPVTSGNILYYQVYRGTASNGSDEAAVGEIQTVGVP